MSIAGRLAVLALRPVAEGVIESVGLPAGETALPRVAEVLESKLSIGGQGLGDVLRRAIDRAWKTFEVALHGGAWLRQVAANPANREITDRLQALMIETEAAMARREAQRRLAVPELKAARKKNYLSMPTTPFEAAIPGLARGAALYARFDDFEMQLKADRSAVEQIGTELSQAGFANLAAMVNPDEGLPLLAMAVRYFFRRAVADQPVLAETFSFARFEELLPELQEAFDNFYQVIALHGRRLEELLGNIATPVEEPRIPAFDLQAEAADAGANHGDLYRDVAELMRRYDLTGHSVRPHDGPLVRSEGERQQVQRVIDRFRTLNPNQRQWLPALANAVARLELACGAPGAAARGFQAVALSLTNPTAKGEAHMNAHRAALLDQDYETATKEYLEAVKADGRRYATFPVGKYIPSRVLGSGGFGTAFLCKHRYMNAHVVVKSLSTEGLDRDVDEVFSEAQTLGAINHPAIIRVQDCGYVDASRKHRPYLVMDHFDGPTLREYVEARGPLSVPELYALVEPIVAGLEAAHDKGIVHRDVKPDNILVKRLPDVGGKPRWDVKLIDFGLSLKQDEQRSSRHAAMSIGTAEFAAPEQLGRLPGGDIGPASDIYGFGKTCCFALFQTTAPLLKHWKSIPQPLADLLERCLNEHPEDRPKDFTIINRCFARLTGAEVPVVTAIAETTRPAASVAPAYDDDRYDDDEEDFIEPPPSGSGAMVVVAVLGVLALVLLLGCGGIVGITSYFWDDITGKVTGTTVASNDGDGPDGDQPNNPAAFGGRNNPVSGRPGPNNGGNVNNSHPSPNPGQREEKTHLVTFNGVPTPEVADFVVERIRGAEDDHWSPKVVKVEKAGLVVTATIEDKPGARADDWVRKLDLGIVERDGDNFNVSVTPPPPPNRTPPEMPELPQLSPLQFRAVVAAFQANKDIKQAMDILKATSPKEEQRSTIRALLKSKVRDAFEGDDAMEALGVWGTPEDIPFLVSLDERNPFKVEKIIKALEKLRDPSAAPYLVGKLKEFFGGDKAMEALRAIGPAAEKEVQKALTGSERDARRRAAKLLKDIGSTASIGVLKTAARDSDREVSQAAWEALKVIAFHPSKPYSAEPATPVVSKPKDATTVDDLKVTELADAAGIVPNMALCADDSGFYTLDPGGNLCRWEWDGKIAANVPARGFALMAVGNRGVILSSSADAKLLDAQNLNIKSSGPIENAKGITTWPKLDFVVLRCEGVVPTIPVVDLGSFSFAALHAERKLPGLKASQYILLPSMAGKTDPVLTPDGTQMFMQGGGTLGRWSVSSYRITSVDATKTLGNGDGKIIVSPDGRYVTLLYKSGHQGTPGQTGIYSTTDLKKPAFMVNHGPQVTALAFDMKGRIWVSTESKSLIRFDATSRKVKEYDLPGGAARQLLVSEDGSKIVVLMKDKLLRVDLP